MVYLAYYYSSNLAEILKKIAITHETHSHWYTYVRTHKFPTIILVTTHSTASYLRIKIINEICA